MEGSREGGTTTTDDFAIPTPANLHEVPLQPTSSSVIVFKVESKPNYRANDFIMKLLSFLVDHFQNREQYRGILPGNCLNGARNELFLMWIPEIGLETLNYGYLFVRDDTLTEEVMEIFKLYQISPMLYSDWILSSSTSSRGSSSDIDIENDEGFPEVFSCSLHLTKNQTEERLSSVHPFLVRLNPTLQCITSDEVNFVHLVGACFLAGTWNDDQFEIQLKIAEERHQLDKVDYLGTITGQFDSTSSITGPFRHRNGDIYETELKLSQQPDSVTRSLPVYDTIIKLLRSSKRRTESNQNTATTHPIEPTHSAINYLLLIPTEILRNIATLLPPSSIAALYQTTQTIKNLLNHDLLWNQLYCQHYEKTLLTVIHPPYLHGYTWKQFFRDTTISNRLHSPNIDRPSKLLYCKGIRPGRYFLGGFTENYQSFGNITRVHEVKLILHEPEKGSNIGSLTAVANYRAGSDYNAECSGIWFGVYHKETRLVFWQEEYGSHDEVFVYRGQIINHNHIVGRYHWTANQAIGRFEFTLKEVRS